MTIFEAIITAIVEGVTEFLPISSTGHMIISSYLLGIHQDEFTKLFEISIQLGAILAVVFLYWKIFFTVDFFSFRSLQFYLKLIVGVLPAIGLGLLFSDTIDALLESPLTVAIAMLLGGVFLLFIDKIFKTHSIKTDEAISFKKAFIVGCWQTIAMIPGVSRSAASIIGGMQQKLTRELAAEFSFFLAVPTMLAATCYSLFLKDWEKENQVRKGVAILFENQQNLICFIIGNIVAFIVALLAIRFFINYLKKNGFKIFGWYRIILGTILLISICSGMK